MALKPTLGRRGRQWDFFLLSDGNKWSPKQAGRASNVSLNGTDNTQHVDQKEQQDTHRRTGLQLLLFLPLPSVPRLICFPHAVRGTSTVLQDLEGRLPPLPVSHPDCCEGGELYCLPLTTLVKKASQTPLSPSPAAHQIPREAFAAVAVWRGRSQRGNFCRGLPALAEFTSLSKPGSPYSPRGRGERSSCSPGLREFSGSLPVRDSAR